MIRLKIISLCVFLLVSVSLFSQTQRIVVKFKQNTPVNILNDFKQNNIRGSVNPLAKIIERYDIFNSEQLFGKYTARLRNIESTGLDRIFILQTNTAYPADCINSLKLNTNVEYAKPVDKLKLESFTPNDTYYNNQYYLQNINIPPVWDFQQGTNALVGIIDSGIDFLHPDLQQSYFINTGEYGNGKENNGIDDDGDGYIDNWRGWNFIDNNNNPVDDNIVSHGSCVAGIISAGFNNGIGISSITGGSKSLILKCFNSQGVGYEDQIATAILYGVMQGVKVFNFSFGDYIYSDLLRDVVRYAYQNNVTIVCSAGNDNSNVLHYPSAFDEVISVAASDELDRKATFSAYGETVDIYAPGVNILTTSRVGQGSAEYGNNYTLANGTSFSSPIVAAVAAVLKTKNPNLTNEEIRGILVFSAQYFSGQSEWNNYYSSGLLNAQSAFQNYNNPSVVRIFTPSLNYSFTNDTVPVAVTAASAFFRSYSLKYGVGENPSSYHDLFSSGSQVIKDTVYRWNTVSLPDTSYTLKLIVYTNNGKTVEHSTIIRKNKSNPVITGYSNGEILFKDGFSELITFFSKEPSKGLVYFKRKNVNEPYSSIYADDGNIGFFTTDHYALLNHFSLIPETEYEFYLEAVSLNGKKVSVNDTSFHFRAKKQIDKYSYIKKPYNLPRSQVNDKVVDIFNNGSRNVFTNNVQLGLTAEIYNFINNRFEKVSSGWIGNNVVRDVILRNNKWDLLSSQQRTGNVFESPSVYQIPSIKIWSNDAGDEFWSSKFADVDGDGVDEILGFGAQGLRIMKFQGSVTPFAVLNYLPANAGNYANSQNVIVGDFDNDAKKEIVFTNSFIDANNNQNTSVNIYKYSSGNSFSLVFHEEYPLVIKGDNLTAGDFDGDGKKEIAVGFSTDLAIPVKLFSVLFIKSTGIGTFSEYNSVEMYNSDAQGELSIKAGDIDNDGRDELISNEGKLLYVLKYNLSSSSFEPQYFRENINSYNSIVYDFDNNGVKEIGINNNDSVIFIEKNIAFAGPKTPTGLAGYILDSNRVALSFQGVTGAQYYKVYRGLSDSTGYNLYDSTYTSVYNDIQVNNKRDYYYKISAVDTTKQIRESVLSEYVKVYVHNKSKITGAVYSKGLLSVKFSEKIQLFIPDIKTFRLNGTIYPSSIGIVNNYEYGLSFKGLINGNYLINAADLKDFYGAPVDTGSVAFAVSTTDSNSFYISNLILTNPNTLKVQFNTVVDTVTSYNTSNYSIDPFNLKIIAAERDKTDKKILYLTVNSNNNIGPGGKTYFIRINNVYSESGIKIVSGSGSVFSLTFVKEDLTGVVAYPNPYSKTKSAKQIITFANLTKTAKVYVFSLSGESINELSETNGDGGIEWDLRDTRGNEIPSGIYIYKVEGKNSLGADVESKMGKFAVVK
ncbi:MAG: S8 family serine peptidase [Ignavibacteriae bacterium]|nr:S8 family serine peptidase [Ignavibacteriota bacterium]